MYSGPWKSYSTQRACRKYFPLRFYGGGGLDWRVCFKSRVLNCARTIVAALWDFEVLHSGLLAKADGIENGVDHGLERGPAIEWGHDESIHGRPGTTVSATLFYGMVL